MSTWLAKALAAHSRHASCCSGVCANCAKCAKTPVSTASAGGFGTNGTIGTASGIAESEIRARFEWIMRRLIEDRGRDPVRADSDAREILKVEVLNDLRLAPVQEDTHRCFVCDGASMPGRALVPVLTARPDTPLWLHLEPCHEEHRRRRSAMADQLLRLTLPATSGPYRPETEASGRSPGSR